jgi:hypothetical protein
MPSIRLMTIGPKGGNTQPLTVFQSPEGNIVQEEDNTEFYSDLREMACDFLGPEGVDELFPIIETSKRFTPLSDTSDSESNAASTSDSSRPKRLIKKILFGVGIKPYDHSFPMAYAMISSVYSSVDMTVSNLA